MKVLVLLGVALLCFTQVQGNEVGDLLATLFKDKVSELNSAKEVPTKPVVFAADPSDECNANEVIQLGSTLLKNTVDIFSETFTVAYNTIYVSNSNCQFGTFRCFLLEFTNTKNMASDVTGKVMSYKNDASKLTEKIRKYFTDCPNNKK